MQSHPTTQQQFYFPVDMKNIGFWPFWRWIVQYVHFFASLFFQICEISSLTRFLSTLPPRVSSQVPLFFSKDPPPPPRRAAATTTTLRVKRLKKKSENSDPSYSSSKTGIHHDFCIDPVDIPVSGWGLGPNLLQKHGKSVWIVGS